MGKTSKRLSSQKRKKATRRTRRTGRTRKTGGNATDGDRLMNMLHENSRVSAKKHSDSKIIKQFNKVKENDLYNSILRKKRQLNREERKKFSQEAYRHQELPMEIHRIPHCRHHVHGKCTRVNPVHCLADRTGAYHPATLTAMAMKDTSF